MFCTCEGWFRPDGFDADVEGCVDAFVGVIDQELRHFVPDSTVLLQGCSQHPVDSIRIVISIPIVVKYSKLRQVVVDVLQINVDSN